MKISQDLRAAIRSAEKMQPSTDSSARRQQTNAAIQAFLKSHPAKAKAIQRLTDAADKAKADREAAERTLCAKFGLMKYGSTLELAGCGNSRANFIKAGGKLPAHGMRWTFDAVMAELAAADPKEEKAILKKYGIRWE